MEKKQFIVRIRFYNNKGAIIAEREYVSLKQPNNGTVATFAKRNGIIYDYFVILK